MPPQTPTPNLLSDLQAYYTSIPPITRFLTTATLLTSLLPAFGLVHPTRLLFIPSKILAFELWRTLTPFFWMPLGFSFLMHLYFLGQNSADLERGFFGGRRADFLVFLGFSAVVINIAAYFLELYSLVDPLLLALIYVWSTANGSRPVSFLFGIQFQAMYLPYVLVAMDVLQGNVFPIPKLLGIAVGWVYWYLEKVVPERGGRRVLVAPRVLDEYVGEGEGRRAEGYVAIPPQRRPGVQPSVTENMRHRWGTGRRLGTG
ncbi:uncharacterized protein SPPG_08943 [Spizellomyces punctatus DAOM BR117]|uniref:Derlin n=1 Tax=Spizellomyces punctatus (strain DAOM BR117) TaxID=645134 RepID=A0A0L0HT84_SPIPD|nr:uncharacterized protein SPPG_08943 [Spizellomyces punctatus DAOM BR117]KND04100.1 hypothetical protein SPPG_08943 [Spizellomyces punctatus DAOM BR117]|eukprot:XP_016612139.1 hypothetical protein SPPG_08943 [Spizellomyces punctatus DAOM BR117]